MLIDYKCQREYLRKVVCTRGSKNIILVCDNCTQTLLDTVDEIMFKFEVNMEGISLHDLKAPWIKLTQLANETDFYNSQFDEFFDAVDAVDNFNDVAADEVSKII